MIAEHELFIVIIVTFCARPPLWWRSRPNQSWEFCLSNAWMKWRFCSLPLDTSLELWLVSRSKLQDLMVCRLKLSLLEVVALQWRTQHIVTTPNKLCESSRSYKYIYNSLESLSLTLYCIAI